MVTPMLEEERLRVLVVEDYGPVARAFCSALGAAGYDAVPARSLAAARECIAAAWAARAKGYAVVLLDLKLPDGAGEELLSALAALRPAPAVAVISGMAAGERALRLLGQGIWVVPKPIDGPALVALVQRLSSRAAPADAIAAFCRAHGLSQREIDVVRAAAEGLTSVEVSERVGCAVHTTAAYWQRIFKKTGLLSQPAVFSAILRFAAQDPREGHSRGR
jgi:DNA-binding NarL/FixJ family response regulator